MRPRHQYRRLAAAQVALHALTLVLAVSGQHATAQTTEADLSLRLVNKPLFLRGCWKGSNLAFDATGVPSKQYPVQPFSLCGLDVVRVHLAHSGLEIEGQAAGLEFLPNGTVKRVRLEAHDYNGKVKLRIDGAAGADFGPALDNVFAPDWKILVPSLQTYWRQVGDHYLARAGVPPSKETVIAAGEAPAPLPPALPTERRPDVASPAQKKGAVHPPVLVQQADPGYSEIARKLAYSGSVEVYLWVDIHGMPSHLEVKRPAGLGLDEQALASVAQYRFKPATQDGRPVLVDLYVDVNFESF